MSKVGEKRFQPKIGVTLATLIVFIALIKQGHIQLSLSADNSEYTKTINKSMSTPAIPMPLEIENIKKWDFTRISMAGNFLYKHEFLIKPRIFNGINGYHVLTPFKRASGKVVMINRGWVSEKRLPEIYRPNTFIKIEGIIQTPKRSADTPNNKPKRSDWYWVDLETMAKEAKINNLSPVIVNTAKRIEGQYPIGGIVHIKNGEHHFYYAILWYLMAILLLNIYYTSQLRLPDLKLELE